ncbi:MAG: (2Fe-2S)-binding protein [Planctomycetes bacterium]|nr:(2Fe-2S)-binding protein [Planctomycetota bacterium]
MAAPQDGTVKLTIDGREVEVSRGTTILMAARKAGIEIPTLCHLDGLCDIGACRVCLVEVAPPGRLLPACTTPASAGSTVKTDTDALRETRRRIIELLFSERNHICPFCPRAGNCELQDLGYRFQMDHVRYAYLHPTLPTDLSHPHIGMDHNRCVLCGRCVRACNDLVGAGTLQVSGRGGKSLIVADAGVPLGESSCTSCGTCVQVCPTGAIYDKRTVHWARRWIPRETTTTTCPRCGVGCRVVVEVQNGRVLATRGDWDGPANGGRICRRARFEWPRAEAEAHRRPLARTAGKLEPTDAASIARDCAARLRTGRVATDPTRAAVVVSPSLPIEVIAAARGFAEECLGGARFDTTDGAFFRALREVYGSAFAPGSRPPEKGIEGLADADLVVALDIDLDEEAPVAGMGLRRRLLDHEATLIEVAAAPTRMVDLAKMALPVQMGGEAALLAAWFAELAARPSVRERFDEAARKELAGFAPDRAAARTGTSADAIVAAARLIGAASSPLFVFGENLVRSGGPLALRNLLALARLIAPAGRVPLASVAGGASSVGAALLGTPKVGLDLVRFDPHEIDVLFLFLGDNVRGLTGAATVNLRAIPFLVALESGPGDADGFAHRIVPVPHDLARAGTLVGIDGRVQTIEPVAGIPRRPGDEFDFIAALADALGRRLPFRDAEGARAWIAERVPAIESARRDGARIPTPESPADWVTPTLPATEES